VINWGKRPSDHLLAHNFLCKLGAPGKLGRAALTTRAEPSRASAPHRKLPRGRERERLLPACQSDEPDRLRYAIEDVKLRNMFLICSKSSYSVAPLPYRG
jgi:hypothetical protein